MAGRVVLFRSQNIMAHNLVEMKFDEKKNMFIVGGPNGQGKTTTLILIAAAFVGKKAFSEKMLKEGMKNGFFEVETNQELDMRIRWEIDKKKEKLIFTTLSGKTIEGKKQNIIDQVRNTLGFDPLRFADLSGTKEGEREQARIIMKLVGIDFTDIDVKRKDVYDKRTRVNQDKAAVEARLEKAPHHDDAPEKEVSVNELFEEITEANKHNMSIDTDKHKLEAGKNYMKGLEENLIEQMKQVTQTEREIATSKTAITDLNAKIVGFKLKDTNAIQAKLDNLSTDNRKVRENEAHREIAQEFSVLGGKSVNLTDKLKEIDDQKATMLSEAKMPIDGMALNDEGLLNYDSKPFSIACKSERIKVSLNVAFALMPNLRLALIEDGSALDKDNLKVIEETAKKFDGQVIIEKVINEDEEVEGAIILQDGYIKGKKPLKLPVTETLEDTEPAADETTEPKDETTEAKPDTKKPKGDTKEKESGKGRTEKVKNVTIVLPWDKK